MLQRYCTQLRSMASPPIAPDGTLAKPKLRAAQTAKPLLTRGFTRFTARNFGLELLAAHVYVAVCHEPAQRLVERVERGVPRDVAEHLLRPGRACRNTAEDVLTGHRRMLGADPTLKLLPLHEVKHRVAPEPAGYSGRQPAQGHRLLRGHVETRADRRRPGERPLESLRHVVGVHVMEHAEAVIGQGKRLPQGQTSPHLWVKVAGRSNPRPARATDVPRMQYDAGHTAGERLAVQQRLDLRFAGPVLAVRGARLILGHGHPQSWPVHPDGAAVHQQRTNRPQGVHQLLGGRPGEAEEIDDGVRAQPRDTLTEGARHVPGLTINRDLLH